MTEPAGRDAHLIVSGSEHMTTHFVRALGDTPAGRIDESTIRPLYPRASAEGARIFARWGWLTSAPRPAARRAGPRRRT